jgi:superfamily II DNA or RNA helicase
MGTALAHTIMSDKKLVVKDKDFQTGVETTRNLYSVQGDRLIVPLAYALNYVDSETVDQRETPTFVNAMPKVPDLNHVKASEQQRQAVPELLAEIDKGKTRFILKMAVGTGKTSTPFHLMAKHKLRTLIIVDREYLAQQFVEFGREQCGINVGFIGGGKDTEGEHCTVAMIQTLMRRPEILEGYGLCVVDEADAMVASQMSQSMQACNAKYYIAMSATASKYKLPTLMAYCGEHVIETENKPQPATIKIVKCLYSKKSNDYTAQYIVPLAKTRVKYLAKLAKHSHDNGRNILVCASAVKLLDSFYEEFTKLKPSVEILKLYDAKKNNIAKNAATASEETSFVLGTYAAVTRGLSIDHLDVLITLDTVTNLDQLAGRVRRPCAGKPEALIYYTIEKGSNYMQEIKQMRKLQNLLAVDKSITWDEEDLVLDLREGKNETFGISFQRDDD